MNGPLVLYSSLRKKQRLIQLLQMRALSTHENGVYCIVRVYNLLSEQIGIRFYIDPWRFREGRLEFDTTEKWKVKPVDSFDESDWEDEDD